MRTISLIMFAGCLVHAGAAGAHILLTNPPDRFSNNSLSPGPCGSGTRANKAPTKLVPGQTLVVTWKEVVSHAGHYRIALSAKESEFTDPTNLNISNPLPNGVLLDGIQDKTGNQTYSQSIQLPDKECPTCVLQVIQVASGGTDGTNTGSLFTVYHTCADVSITGAASDGGVAQDALSAFDGAATRGDTVAVVDGAVSAGGRSGQDGAGGAPASSGGASGAAGATAGPGGLSAVSSESSGSPPATGGQSESGRVSSGGATSGSDSVAASGGRSSLAAEQGGGGYASSGGTTNSGGVSGTAGGSSAVAVTASATGGRSEGSKPAAVNGGCHIGQGPDSNPWLMLAIVLVLPRLLRRKSRRGCTRTSPLHPSPCSSTVVVRRL